MRVSHFSGTFIMARPQNQAQTQRVLEISQQQAEQHHFLVERLPCQPDQLVLGTKSTRNDHLLKEAFKANGIEFSYSPKTPESPPKKPIVALKDLEERQYLGTTLLSKQERANLFA